MKLMLLTLALTLGVGYLLGGRLSNLADLRIRWAPLAVVGFAMQLINPPGRWPLVMLLGSFVLLSVFAIANLRTPGFGVILDRGRARLPRDRRQRRDAGLGRGARGPRARGTRWRR